MLKKMGTVMVFIVVFMASLEHFSYVLSEPDIRVHLFKGDQREHLQILLPTSMERLYAQIIDGQGREKAYVVRDYHSMIKVNNTTYHQYILSSNIINFEVKDKLLLFPKTKDMKAYTISSLPTTDMVKNSEVANQPISIKVMTYNIHHGRDRLGFSTMDEIADIIRTEKPDIVGLQEVDQNMVRTARENQVKILAESLGMYYSFGPNKTHLSGNYGNALLSKYPILKSENIGLPGKEQRGVLHGTIKVKDQTLHTMVTHLDLDPGKQQASMKALKDHVNMYEDKLILMGDFNSQPWGSGIQDMQNLLVDTGAYWGENHVPTYNYFAKEARIDYIFITRNYNSMSYEVINNRASDHYPVITTILLQEE